MRIAQFANFYAPTSGGLRTFVEETGRGYTDHGHDRVLIVPGLVDADEQTSAGRRVTFASPPMFGSDEYRMLTARRRVTKLLTEFAPDVLEINDKMAVTWLTAWARRHLVPTVLVSHERLDPVLRDRLPGKLPLVAAANAINRVLGKRVDRIVAASAFSAAEFARAGIRGVLRVPLGVDLDNFHPAEGPTARDRGGPVELVLVSRLSPEKNPLLAIEAVRVLHAAGMAVHLTIIGDGPLRGRAQLLAEGLPVHFAGHLADRARLARLVAAADVALCPSSVETFGLASLEALACGTAVVVPPEGALRELPIDPATGSVDPCAGVVRPATPTGFADGVRALLAVPTSLRRAAARSCALRYPWSATVRSLLGVHESLVRAGV